MRKPVTLPIAILLLAAGCSRSEATSNGIATDDGIAAIALPEEQYRDLLKRSAMMGQSGPMALYALGFDKGCEVLDESVDKVVGKNLPQWRASLIASYRKHVPAQQLAEAVQMSPSDARSSLQAHLPAIAASMKSESEPLLAKSFVEVVKSLTEAAAKVDRTSIDMAARKSELERVKASREICGVKA